MLSYIFSIFVLPTHCNRLFTVSMPAYMLQLFVISGCALQECCNRLLFSVRACLHAKIVRLLFLCADCMLQLFDCLHAEIVVSIPFVSCLLAVIVCFLCLCAVCMFQSLCTL